MAKIESVESSQAAENPTGTEWMNFLFLGKDNGRINQLAAMLGRNDIVLDHTETPEAAFFEIIRGAVQALILDTTDPDLDPNDVIAGLESIDNHVELVLIADYDSLHRYSENVLRRCYGILQPHLRALVNAAVLRELTEKITLKQRIKSLRNTSIIDGLTQLHNHAYFQQHLDREIEMAQPDQTPITLVMFDIDHFKNYNDTNGHPAGDDVLRKIAKLLEKTVRKFDFTARYGGEEFVIVFPNVGLKTALKVTERFRQKIEQTAFEFGHLQPMGFVSASFGVACLDHKIIQTKQELIHMADQALYRAKEHSRNAIWYCHDGQFSQFQSSLLG